MKLLFLLLILMPFKLLAWNCNPEDETQYANCMKEIEDHLSGEVTCDPTGAPAPETQCEKKYNQMYSDGTLNITLAGGYFDSSPSDGVYGEYWNNRAIETMTGPCPTKFELLSLENYSGTKEEVTGPKKDREHTGCGKPSSFQQTCGFTRTDDPEILTKTIVVKGKPSLVKVRVLSASLTTSDKQNRDSLKKLIEIKFCLSTPPVARDTCIKKSSPPAVSLDKLKSSCAKGDQHLYQICKSEYVKKVYKDSIVNGDEIVAYSGHARDGGGPSFEPPRLLSDGHVNYPWYRKNRPGHQEEVAAFKEALKKGKAPAIYSSLSCNGHSHFYKHGQFPEVSASTAYVLSKRTSYPDEAIVSLLSTIEGALTRQCGDKLDQSITGASCAFKLYNF